MPAFYSDVASSALRKVQAAKKPVVPTPPRIYTNGNDLYVGQAAAAAPAGTLQPIKSYQGDVSKDPDVTPPVNPDAGGAPSAAPTAYTPTIDPFILAQANDAYARAVNSINQGRQGTLSKYGYRATGYDDQGNALGLDVDPNSLFGSFQQLLQQQAGESIAAEDESLGRGFHGAGLGRQTEGALKYQWGAQDLDLGRGLQSTLGQYGQAALQAKADKDKAIFEGNLDAINSAIADGDYTPVTDDYVPPTPWAPDAVPTSTVTSGANITRPSVKGNTVLWNNQYMNAQKLANTLAKQGVSVRTFVQNHPAAAKAIGLKVPAPPKPKAKKK